MEYLDENPEIGILGGWIETTPSTPAVNQWFNRGIDLNDPAQWLGHNNLAHCTVAIRSEVHQQIGFLNPNLKYTHDWELWLRAVENGVLINQIPIIVADYRVSTTGLSARDSFETLREYLSMCSDHWYPYLQALNRNELIAIDLTQVLVAYAGRSAGADREELSQIVDQITASIPYVLPDVVGRLSVECHRLQLMAEEQKSLLDGPNAATDLSNAKTWLEKRLSSEIQYTNVLEIRNAQLDEYVSQLEKEVELLRRRLPDRINGKLRGLRAKLRG